MTDPAARLKDLESRLAVLQVHTNYVPPQLDPAVVQAAVQLTKAQDQQLLEQNRQLCVKLSGAMSKGWALHSIGLAAELSHFATQPDPTPPICARGGQIFRHC